MAVVLDYLAGFKIPQYVAVSAPPPPRNPGGKLLERRLRTDTDRAAARAVWPAGIPAGPPTGYLACRLTSLFSQGLEGAFPFEGLPDLIAGGGAAVV